MYVLREWTQKTFTNAVVQPKNVRDHFFIDEKLRTERQRAEVSSNCIPHLKSTVAQYSTSAVYYGKTKVNHTNENKQ